MSETDLKPGKPFWGLFRRCECLVPTWRGWVLVLMLMATLVVGVGGNLHAFLAVTAPVPAEVMVVEGWAPDYAYREAVAEFKRGGYRKVYVTGGSLEQGSHLSDYQTYAKLGAALLARMDLSGDVVEAVPAERVRQDRTHASAVALSIWMQQNNATPASFNVVSFGAHARRSWLLFEKVFEGRAKVGVIAVEDRDYDSKRWWRASQGVRVVLDELIAYGYAKFLFSPPKELSTSPVGAR
jgi:hypothetical protein